MMQKLMMGAAMSRTTGPSLSKSSAMIRSMTRTLIPV